ncbi:MAG: DsbC family protein [Gammaproteobacteria bacterium]
MFRHVLFAVAVLLSSLAAASGVPKDVESAIRARIGGAMPGVEISQIIPAPLPGMFAVVLDGSETAYVSADGQYLISGDLYRATPKGLVNVTEESKGPLRREALAKLKPADMITFAAKGKERAKLYVFTDVDCGYCRKMHQEVPELNAAGVTVHYLAFPRSGAKTETARKMDSAWCAPDRNGALTELKRGRTLPAAPAACQSPVADQYKQGVALGVRGTPAVFLVDGEQVGGYVPAAQLLSKLGLR